MNRNLQEYRNLFAPIDIIIPEGIVLDSGCGLGYACRDINNFYGNTTAIGISMTSVMLSSSPSSTSSTADIIFHDMEQSLPLRYGINAAIDVYGALSYCCYPLKVLSNMLALLVPNGKIYVYCTFECRLNNIYELLRTSKALHVEFFDDRMIIVKLNEGPIACGEQTKFYPAGERERE